MTTPVTPPSWTRRFSHPALPLPTLPNISAFRAALLGYLGEVEISLRGDPTSSSTFVLDADNESVSTAVPGPSTGLRNRKGNMILPLLGDTNTSLLNHLSNLREDVVAYLPSRLSVPVPPGIGPSREWIRSLPSKLSVVDLGVTTADGESQVEAARRRVIEMVHTLLPSEDWAGWESLGWEDKQGRVKSLGMDGEGEGEGEFEDEEPEYLFPNRTPASQNSLASRRRAVRSKSLSCSTSFRPGPKLFRSRTEPPKESWLATQQTETDEKEDVLTDDPDDVDIVDSPELGDTKLTPAIAPSSNLGPTRAETLIRSDDGKRLIEYEDLPYVWRNNEHISTG